MTSIDVEQLLQEVSLEEPCGADLEYDPGFAEMERAAMPKPPPEFEPDRAPEAPNWREVKKKAEALLARSKDLRVAIYLTRALLATEGLSGFAQGIGLLRRLLEEFWDTVHPMLDAEDNDDPTMRVNALLTLCDGDRLLKELREAPLVSSRAIGQFGLRDLHIASGQILLPPGAQQPDQALIDAAFMDCAIDELVATNDGVMQSLEHGHAVERILLERLGAQQAPSFSELVDTLSEMSKILAERLSRRGMGTESTDAAVAAGEESAQAVEVVNADPTAINGREDVVRVLDRICDWYAREEPSSPVPLLLTRAKRLISKSFLEILEDMTPDGVSQAKMIGGVDSDD